MSEQVHYWILLNIFYTFHYPLGDVLEISYGDVTGMRELIKFLHSDRHEIFYVVRCRCLLEVLTTSLYVAIR